MSYKSVKIISNPVKICSFIIFPMCFIVNISLFFAEIFKERILLSLIIPKLSRRIALTIANAPFTLCAENETALTSFAFLQLRNRSGAGRVVSRPPILHRASKYALHRSGKRENGGAMLQNCNEKFANLGFIPYICPCYGKARRGIGRDCEGYAAHHARRNVVHQADEQNGHEVRHQRGNAQETAANGLRQLFRAKHGRTPLQPLSNHILGRPGGARHVPHASVRAQAAHQGEGAHLS